MSVSLRILKSKFMEKELGASKEEIFESLFEIVCDEVFNNDDIELIRKHISSLVIMCGVVYK